MAAKCYYMKFRSFVQNSTGVVIVDETELKGTLWLSNKKLFFFKIWIDEFSIIRATKRSSFDCYAVFHCKKNPMFRSSKKRENEPDKVVLRLLQDTRACICFPKYPAETDLYSSVSQHFVFVDIYHDSLLDLSHTDSLFFFYFVFGEE